MSDATMTAMVIGIPAFFTGLASFIVALRGSRRVEVVEHKADTIIEKAKETDSKANILIEETAKIHTLTNSTLSTTTAALAVANAKIEGFITAQQVADKKIEDLQSLVITLVEQERGIAKAVNETNGILKKDSGPLPVVDDQLANKIDGIVTPKLNKIQDTVDEKT